LRHCTPVNSQESNSNRNNGISKRSFRYARSGSFTQGENSTRSTQINSFQQAQDDDDDDDDDDTVNSINSNYIQM
jgi:hypothetical protein